METKVIYRHLCENEGDKIPLFQQWWWMDAVCAGKKWDVALAYDQQRVSAALPYLVGSKCGLKYIIQPQLTQFCGPWYHYPDSVRSENQRLVFEQNAASELIRQVDRIHPLLFQQNFSPAVTNWLPFYWEGFRQTTRYTYRINDISNPEAVFSNFNKNERQRRILKLQPQTHISTLSPAEFADFQSLCRKQQHQRNLLPYPLVADLATRASDREQGLLLGLRKNDDRQLIAAAFAPFDSNFAYFLIPAVLEPFRSEGAMETLVWHLIEQLSPKTRGFDFEGSMQQGIEHFYRSFGAIQTPYFCVSKCPIRALI